MNVFKNVWNKVADRLRTMPERRMLLILGFFTGLASGLAAVILKKLIILIETGVASVIKLPFNLYLLIIPGLGLLLSFLFVKYAVKDDISHGVTKVLLAISRNESQIKHHNIWSSIAASALTIGFGGSVGAEAPIVYAGAAIGSNMARDLKLPQRDITILLGCGAAGAIAGIFKAPLAGVAFTLEILMFNISMTSILPLLISTITATVTSMLLLGENVVFASSIEKFAMANIPWYLVLGVVCGAVSLYFMRTTLFLEDKIKKISNPYVRWIICAAGLGALIYIFPPLFGEGYGSLTNLLNNEAGQVVSQSYFMRYVSSAWGIVLFFVAVMILKVLAMCLTNAGGGVGGTFGPTLFVGGIAGFVLARILNISGLAVPEANFVLVGMGGLMAGVMQAPLTSIFLIAEITGGYQLLVPLIITSSISFATIRSVEQYSIYTKRLANSGDLITHDSDKAVLTLLKTSDFIEMDFVTMRAGQTLGDIVEAIKRKSGRSLFPVLDQNDVFLGVIYFDDIRKIMFDQSLYSKVTVESLMKPLSVYVTRNEPMESVMNKFEETGAWNLPVLDSENHYFGFVSRSRIISAYRSQLKEVSHD